MGASNYDVYGDVAGIQGLAEDQQAHLGRFTAIMSQINEQSESTVSKWEGSGSPQFQSKAQEFDTHFSEVNSAFATLIAATSDTADNYGKLTRYLDGLF
ncbi:MULTISPECIES: WXG100 family type VII secretion target [Nocardiopsis]|uniref:WXG100 family type VII secretion target n=1 Tax=Nocardiopsis lambiniae TaxID=3075539 RepID=A0ABU2M604_9ACTN|nr:MULTISPECIES: WXG100 family type VII secretion target [unclassified Nocardiopsis]MDE3723054.1 WXG100 family type VII secretion target [Nocardiopsis sp. N85]MDT0328045.1 WXG100 family type VII secretion target [Nocardiopsis sp. DSM 44743]